jgi:hypothetical protein
VVSDVVMTILASFARHLFSRSKWNRRACPRWSTANVISNPSLVKTRLLGNWSPAFKSRAAIWGKDFNT